MKLIKLVLIGAAALAVAGSAIAGRDEAQLIH